MLSERHEQAVELDPELAWEPLLQRLVSRRRVWIATVLVNARIMSIYLWHLTMLGVLVRLDEADHRRFADFRQDPRVQALRDARRRVPR